MLRLPLSGEQRSDRKSSSAKERYEKKTVYSGFSRRGGPARFCPLCCCFGAACIHCRRSRISFTIPAPASARLSIRFNRSWLCETARRVGPTTVSVRGLPFPRPPLYDILASSGGAFNTFYPSNPNIGGTGVVPLGTGIVWATPSANTAYGPFGGATATSTPGGFNFTLADSEAPNSASVAVAAMSADFTVGSRRHSGGHLCGHHAFV